MNAFDRREVPTVRRQSGVQTASTLRGQTAIVWTLLDEIERSVPPESDDALSEQLIEELTRLGCRCVELASVLSSIAKEQARLRCGSNDDDETSEDASACRAPR